jgi:hypothetical protein
MGARTRGQHSRSWRRCNGPGTCAGRGSRPSSRLAPRWPCWARSCRLVERTGHGRYRIPRPASPPTSRPGSWIRCCSRAGATHPLLLIVAIRQQTHPVSTHPTPPQNYQHRSRVIGERACGNFSSGPSSASVGEAQGLAPGCPGAVAGSSSAPAERARTRPATSPARAPLEPLGAWRGSIPNRPQLRRGCRPRGRILDGPGGPRQPGDRRGLVGTARGPSIGAVSVGVGAGAPELDPPGGPGRRRRSDQAPDPSTRSSGLALRGPEDRAVTAARLGASGSHLGA